MADDIPVPFTDSEVDPTEPSSAVMTIVLLIAGFTVFAMASSIGDYLANVANSQLGDLIGVNPATGEDSDGVPGV